MRILALNGSHRGHKGCTQFLLDKLAEGAREQGAYFETIALAEHNIKPCTGCDACHTTLMPRRCIHENADDVKGIFERMKQADLLIYASPVYIFSITGVMKTFLDRFNSTAGTGELGLTKSGLFFGPVAGEIYSKPFVILTCCGNVEMETAKNVVSYFHTFSRFLDAPIVGTLVRRTVGVLEPGKKPESDKQSQLIERVLNAYTQAGRELATLGKITPATEKQANQNLLGIPLMDTLMKFRWFKELALKKARQSGGLST